MSCMADNCRCSPWDSLGIGEGEGKCHPGHAHTGHHLRHCFPGSLWQGSPGLLQRGFIWQAPPLLIACHIDYHFLLHLSSASLFRRAPLGLEMSDLAFVLAYVHSSVPAKSSQLGLMQVLPFKYKTSCSDCRSSHFSILSWQCQSEPHRYHRAASNLHVPVLHPDATRDRFCQLLYR